MKRLKELRKAQKVTQLRLGNYIGVSQETVSGYESGKTDPPVDVLIKLAEYFHTSVDYIVGRVDDKRPYNIVENELPEVEAELVASYRRLSPARQERACGYVSGLLEGMRKK